MTSQNVDLTTVSSFMLKLNHYHCSFKLKSAGSEMWGCSDVWEKSKLKCSTSAKNLSPYISYWNKKSHSIGWPGTTSASAGSPTVYLSTLKQS